MCINYLDLKVQYKLYYVVVGNIKVFKIGCNFNNTVL